MNKHISIGSILSAGLVLAVVLVSAAIGVGRREPGVVRADPPEPYTYGYFDQTTENSFFVELSPGPFEGLFAVVIPGTGVFWSSEVVTVTEELDGSFTLSFDDAGILDAEASIDVSGLPTFITSDDAQPVSFEFSGTLSEDLGTLELEFGYNSQVYNIDSAPAPQTAGDVIDDTIEAFENANWTALRLLFVDTLTDEFDNTEFASMIASSMAPFGDLDSVEAVGSVIYELNPTSGAQLATVVLEFTFLVGMSPEQHQSRVSYIYRESSWQLLEIDTFDDVRSLEFLAAPGTSVAEEAFLTQPSLSVLTSTGVANESDDATAVTLAIGDGPNGAVLSCTGGLSATAVDGIVEFAGCALDTPGEYTLVATAAGLTEVETDTFRVVQLRGEVGVNGSSLTLTTLSRGASVWFEFVGNDEGNVSLLIESGDIESASLYLRRQDSGNLVNGGNLEAGSAFFEFRNPGALEDADYFLVARGLEGDVGDFTASLYTFEDVADEVEADGQTYPLITTGPGANARFDFDMAGGTSLMAAVTMSTPGVSGSVILYDDQDSFVSYAEVVNSSATLYSTPLAAGDYYLVFDANGPAVGTISVTPTAIADEIVVSSLDTPEEIELTAAGQNGRLRFTATTGAMVAVDVEASDFESFNVYVVDDVGNFLTGGYVDSVTGHVDAVEIPANGTYEVWILPWSGETGTATVTAVDETP